jgi:ubiquinone/menaquinone biosynthesis C-methylase UbiE
MDTSWETSSSWYDKLVGAKGHYYHQQLIIPGVLNILEREKRVQPHILDLACGQGVLSRHLPKGIKYLGIDASESLIHAAKGYPIKGHQYFLHDLSHPLSLPYQEFTHATCILAVQNFAHPLTLFKTAHAHLKPGSPFICVLNHPCFRIPRQSSWGIDAEKKWQYRRVDRYMSPLKIPIQTNPSQEGKSESTLTFHLPLSEYTQLLKQAGFVIDYMEEWCSDKKSTGKNAQMENKSRLEFPLFLTLVAKKVPLGA